WALASSAIGTAASRSVRARATSALNAYLALCEIMNPRPLPVGAEHTASARRRRSNLAFFRWRLPLVAAVWEIGRTRRQNEGEKRHAGGLRGRGRGLGGLRRCSPPVGNGRFGDPARGRSSRLAPHDP